jgi:excisionase family DNA binding protein
VARSTTKKKTEPTVPDAKFVTAKEAAALFRVTQRTIERWAAAGYFHPVTIGRQSLIPRVEIVAALNTHSSAPWAYEFTDGGELVAKTAEGKQVRGF